MMMRLASGGGSKTKAFIVEGWREVPGERDCVCCWPGVVGESPDDELAWQRELSELNPDLPVDAFLTEGILLAGDALYGTWDRRRLAAVIFLTSSSLVPHRKRSTRGSSIRICHRLVE